MNIFKITALAMLLCGCAGGGKQNTTIVLPENPVDVQFGDPFILKAAAGKFYNIRGGWIQGILVH